MEAKTTDSSILWELSSPNLFESDVNLHVDV